MALTDKLTAIADAIRGRTGKSDGLTLEQMAAEIAGIQARIGAGNELSYPCDTYALYAQRVVVGENTVTSSAALKTYFEGLCKGETVLSFALCGEWTANNQAVCYPAKTGSEYGADQFIRYRNGVLNAAQYNSPGDDCTLAEGTEYVIVSYTCVPF